MKYYKALGDFHDWFSGTCTSMGELLTPRERHTKYRYISDDKFAEVAMSPKDVTHIFGKRWARA